MELLTEAVWLACKIRDNRKRRLEREGSLGKTNNRFIDQEEIKILHYHCESEEKRIITLHTSTIIALNINI